MTGPATPPRDNRVAAIAAMQRSLQAASYICERDLAATLMLMGELGRPLLVEGDPGVGKTEIAKALARTRQATLIRLQCFEGLDLHHALYEWNYQRQLLAIKAREGSCASVSEVEAQIFSEDYLLERPLLAAIRREKSPVLLVDEVDRADEEFEAFLLELLSDFQVTIPEFGTIAARSIPRVVLTSNGTRELSDALRRRCLYHYLDFPDVDREAAIILMRLPAIDASLALQVARMVGLLRKEDLRKIPGIAETLDWAATLAGLGVEDLSAAPELVFETLIALLKTQEDRARVTIEVAERLLGKVA
jgi:MoxR-like ATPase